jgi:hypothetical protein
VNTLLHVIVCVILHNLLNVLVQIANKMGLQNKHVRNKHRCNRMRVYGLDLTHSECDLMASFCDHSN